MFLGLHEHQEHVATAEITIKTPETNSSIVSSIGTIGPKEEVANHTTSTGIMNFHPKKGRLMLLRKCGGNKQNPNKN